LDGRTQVIIGKKMSTLSLPKSYWITSSTPFYQWNWKNAVQFPLSLKLHYLWPITVCLV
jgi:hypothetical protein